jgi:NADPH-dependent curcumin reductase CurA
MTTTARQIVLAARPDGKPKLTDFRLEEVTIPTPNPGQILLGVQYLSLDPYMRGRMDDRKSARVPVCGLIAQYNGASHSDGTDHLPATMRQILSRSLTLRGFIYYDFAEKHYADFLREVGAGIADGSIRYREDIVDGLEKAREAFIGMLDGRNFGKVIIRVAA